MLPRISPLPAHFHFKLCKDDFLPWIPSSFMHRELEMMYSQEEERCLGYYRYHSVSFKLCKDDFCLGFIAPPCTESWR